MRVEVGAVESGGGGCGEWGYGLIILREFYLNIALYG